MASNDSCRNRIQEGCGCIYTIFALIWYPFEIVIKALLLWLSMRRAGRTMSYANLLQKAETQSGTVLYELTGISGGNYYMWWTEEDVAALSPVEPLAAEVTDLHGGERSQEQCQRENEFTRWLCGRYTHRQAGKALLVSAMRSGRLEAKLKRAYPDMPQYQAWSGGLEFLEFAAEEYEPKR